MSNITNLLAKMKVPAASTIMYENTGTWPSSPTEGMTVFKDQILYIYATIATVETWYPLTNTRENYIHTQGVAASTWTVEHNLGSTDFIFMAYDNTGEVVQIVSPTAITTNSFELEMLETIAGRVVVFISSEVQTAIVLSDMFEQTGDDITVKGNLIPSEDNTWSLGSASKQWADAHVSANTIYIGENTTIDGTGVHVQPPSAPTLASEQPEVTSSAITLNSFSYNDGAPQIINPTIKFNAPLTVGAGNQDINIDCGTSNLVITAANFGVDASGNVTLDGSLDGQSFDGGVW